MRLYASRVIKGPISLLVSSPGPIRKALTRASKLLTIWLPVSSPTQTATEIAMQRSPQEPYAAPIRAFTALSMFASGIITA